MPNSFLQGLEAGSQVMGSTINTYEGIKRQKAAQQLAQEKLALMEQAGAQKGQALQAQEQQISQLDVAKLRAAQDAHNKALMFQNNPGLFSNVPAVRQAAALQFAREYAASHPDALTSDDANQMGAQTGKHPLTGQTVPVTQPAVGALTQQAMGATDAQASKVFAPSAQPAIGDLTTQAMDKTDADASSVFAPSPVTPSGVPRGTAVSPVSEWDSTKDNSSKLTVPTVETIAKNIAGAPNFTASSGSRLGDLERQIYSDKYMKAMKEAAEVQRNTMYDATKGDPDAYKQAIADIMGMGINAGKARLFVAGGGTVTEARKQLGIPDHIIIQPKQVLTGANLTYLQRQKMGTILQAPLSNFVNNVLAGYTKTIPFMQYSVKQIIQETTNKNLKEQEELLAAKALQTEVIGSRMRTTGLNPSQRLLADMRKDAFKELNIPSFDMNSEVVRAANVIVENVLSDGYNDVAKAMEHPQSLELQGQEGHQTSTYFRPANVPKGFESVAARNNWYSTATSAQIKAFKQQQEGK